MATTTVRVTEDTHQLLHRLAARTGKPVEQVLEDALVEYDRRLYFDQIDADYKRLQADPAAWSEYLAELAEWDAVLADGLDDEGPNADANR